MTLLAVALLAAGWIGLSALFGDPPRRIRRQPIGSRHDEGDPDRTAGSDSIDLDGGEDLVLELGPLPDGIYNVAVFLSLQTQGPAKGSAAAGKWESVVQVRVSGTRVQILDVATTRALRWGDGMVVGSRSSWGPEPEFRAGDGAVAVLIRNRPMRRYCAHDSIEGSCWGPDSGWSFNTRASNQIRGHYRSYPASWSGVLQWSLA